MLVCGGLLELQNMAASTFDLEYITLCTANLVQWDSFMNVA